MGRRSSCYEGRLVPFFLFFRSKIASGICLYNTFVVKQYFFDRRSAYLTLYSFKNIIFAYRISNFQIKFSCSLFLPCFFYFCFHSFYCCRFFYVKSKPLHLSYFIINNHLRTCRLSSSRQ